jgi:hypothetical protein
MQQVLVGVINLSCNNPHHKLNYPTVQQLYYQQNTEKKKGLSDIIQQKIRYISTDYYFPQWMCAMLTEGLGTSAQYTAIYVGEKKADQTNEGEDF